MYAKHTHTHRLVCVCVYICLKRIFMHMYHGCNEIDISAHEMKSNTFKEGVVRHMNAFDVCACAHKQINSIK